MANDVISLDAWRESAQAPPPEPERSQQILQGIREMGLTAVTIAWSREEHADIKVVHLSINQPSTVEYVRLGKDPSGYEWWLGVRPSELDCLDQWWLGWLFVCFAHFAPDQKVPGGSVSWAVDL